MKTRWIAMPIFVFLMVGTKQLLPADEAAEPATPAEALAIKNGCMECHSVDSTQGPTFQDIADRYQDDEETRWSLFKSIRYGGKGNWSEVSRGVPMPPYSNRLTEDEINSLIDWILTQ